MVQLQAGTRDSFLLQNAQGNLGPILLFNVYAVLYFRAAKLPVRDAGHWHPSGLSKAFMASTESNFPYIYLKSISLEVRR